MKDRQFNLLRWMPTAASVGLMALIVSVSVATVAELKTATYWREHTFKVILDAQAFEDKLVDAQRSVRSYVEKGQSSLLIEYKNDTNIDLQEFNEMRDLTRDNEGQQQRLRDLEAAVKAVFANDNKVIGLYARQGSEAALRVDESSDSMDASDRAIDDLEKFTGKEKELLAERDAREQSDYHRAARLLVAGSIFVAGLLILANFMGSREMLRRRRAEAEQRELVEKLKLALAEVKTMSGLIPICGWCKNVRSDSGFWQSVEQYVRAHTDATFTHGICPECQQKFKAEIARANDIP